MSEVELEIVEKVLEEMKNVETSLNGCQAYWWEEYLNCRLPQEYLDRCHEVNLELDAEVSKIDAATETTEYMGIPLKHLMLGGEYSCDVCSIKWASIETRHSLRSILFHNNGDIEFSKDAKKQVTKQHPRKVSYSVSYNVSRDDFNVVVTITDLIRKNIKEQSEINISLKDNILKIEAKGITNSYNLNTGLRTVRIEKGRDKTSNATVLFEARIGADGHINKGALAIDTHKSNGKVNGHYRIDVSEEKGVRANFYSRKGVKIDLSNHPALLVTANKQLLGEGNSQISSDGDLMLKEFSNYTENAIYRNLGEREIRFDASLFNMGAVLETEREVMNLLKSLSGEPLVGLSQRIAACLNRMYGPNMESGQKRLLMEE